MATVLTIAGFDPSSGAGVTADLAVFAAHGLFGTACITALTVQSTLGVASTHPVSGAIVRATLEHLEADLPPDGIKIGMLATQKCVEAVACYLEGLKAAERRTVVVLDPVIRSSSGRELLEPSGVKVLRDRLLPLVDWVTPNHDEIRLLAESEETAVTREDLLASAHSLQRDHPRLGILVTGGHHEPPDDLLLTPGVAPAWIAGEKVVTRSTHGTGCGHSSALLCALVRGQGVNAAARSAKEYVVEGLRRARPVGHGTGPMDHLWPLRQHTELR